ncbi:MMPL family transporter [Streptantibioticus silvisoli]|uniref:MMPL family transporter n=1 Tax=Streptantibioticus silvisoli TaxID=2705255 RepID=A0ABT6VTK0_9ACTN|nr:MMPL family transporter [Streptantibioticus silvisoli]MDI5961779.1 MMPL family transporter [Streptantibioticus silvisoli]
MCAATRRPVAAAAPGRLERLGRWCARHWPVVVVGWVIALVAVHVLQAVFGGAYADDFSLPDSPAQHGLDVLRAHDRQAGGVSGTVVLRDRSAALSSAGDEVTRAVTALDGLPHVITAVSPLPPAGSSQPTGALSPDGHIGYITVRFDKNPSALGASYLGGVDRAVAPLRSAGVEVEYGGPLGELARPAGSDLTSEVIGFAVAVAVLLAAFGSVLAALLPLLTALLGVVVGLGLLGLLAAAATFASVSPTLATMIGLGVGIDYALFLSTRHRQQVLDGVPPVAAAGRATATSGRAVLVSGCTVVVALAGLYVSGVGFIGKLGVAAGVTVVTAVATALTLVPALLGAAGRAVDRLRVRRAVAEPASPDGTGGWHRYAARVRRAPWWFALGGVVVVLVLAVPLPSMRLGHVDDGADPVAFTDRRAFDLIATGFGVGANGPLTVVVDRTAVPSADRAALDDQVASALKDLPGAAGATAAAPAGDGDVLLSSVVPAGAPQDAGTTDLVNRLKDTVLPKAVAGTAAAGYVTGTTAAQVDFLDIVTARLPLIIAVVVALAFVIVLAVFRGPLVALKAAVLNLLSIAASYGVVVAVFQWGWGGPALGVSGRVPIESYVPMMMFAIVFGLSMDYEVFLLSRVRERWLATGDAPGAMAYALEVTARVIGCAALIMVSVFAAFLLSDDIVVKMLGLGLAVSVAIDATVVRLLLVPAVMTLLGRGAWWAPRWLERVLPRLDPEGGGR